MTHSSLKPKNDDPLATLFRSHPETAFAYLEFRRLMAGPAAAFAAERASDADIAHLAQCLKAMEEAHALDDPQQEAAADAAFHLAIYEFSGNQVMATIMRRLIDMLRSGVFYDRTNLYLRRGVRDGFLRQHQAIYSAIAARNPDAAKAAADAHILSTKEALREAQNADLRRDISLRRLEGSDLVVNKAR